MSGALLLNWVLKAAVHRARPVAYFGTDPESLSFPSGHVFFAVSFYGAICLVLASHRKLTPFVSILSTLLVGAVAWSRVYLGVHYPTDVAAGFLIGVFWLGVLFVSGLFFTEA